jgi:hypothetical protein
MSRDWLQAGCTAAEPCGFAAADLRGMQKVISWFDPRSLAVESMIATDRNDEPLPVRFRFGLAICRGRVDTYILLTTPTNGRAVKPVTVVLYDGNALSARPFARIMSTLDSSTG